MTGWLKARSDLRTMQEFRDAVYQLWEIEGRAVTGHEHELDWLPFQRQQQIQTLAHRQTSEYARVRQEVARRVLPAIWIARENGVPVDLKSTPPPVVGGFVIPVNIFQAILEDNSHGGIPHQLMDDTLNQSLGVLEGRVRRELLRLLNPINWVFDALGLVLRLPFKIVQATGFNVSKVEDHLFGKLFKLLELAVLAYLLTNSVLGQDVKEILIKLASK